MSPVLHVREPTFLRHPGPALHNGINFSACGYNSPVRIRLRLSFRSSITSVQVFIDDQPENCALRPRAMGQDVDLRVM